MKRPAGGKMDLRIDKELQAIAYICEPVPDDKCADRDKPQAHKLNSHDLIGLGCELIWMIASSRYASLSDGPRPRSVDHSLGTDTPSPDRVRVAVKRSALRDSIQN